MRVRLSVFLLMDEQWRQNLVKNKNKKINISDIRRRLYFMCYLFFVLPYFDVTHDQPLKKNMAKFDITYFVSFYHLFKEPKDEHGGIDASNQQSQHEGK